MPHPWATALLMVPLLMPARARGNWGCSLALASNWPSIEAFVNAISRAVHAEGLGAKV